MTNMQNNPDLQAGLENVKTFVVAQMENRGFPGLIIDTNFDSDRLRVYFKAEIDANNRTLVILSWENVIDSHAGLLENTKLRILARLEESISNFGTNS